MRKKHYLLWKKSTYGVQLQRVIMTETFNVPTPPFSASSTAPFHARSIGKRLSLPRPAQRESPRCRARRQVHGTASSRHRAALPPDGRNSRSTPETSTSLRRAPNRRNGTRPQEEPPQFPILLRDAFQLASLVDG